MKQSSYLSKRILSLDVFRGLTMFFMILVNSQSTSTPYNLLVHSKWNGCSLADLVFPSFLYIVGLTCVVSLNRHLRLEGQGRFELYQSILRRSLILFILGIFLNAFPNHFNLMDVRIYGILQRIALCYFACSIIYLNTSINVQILLCFLIVLGYWAMMTLVPVPDIGVNQITKDGTWVAYFDQKWFSPNQLFGKVYDPESLISTIPSIATTLLGVLSGSLMLSPIKNLQKLYYLFSMGCILLVLGWCWNFTFPINKQLWTSSFVLWSGGFAVLGFAFCFWLIDVLDFKLWSLPLRILGMNALFIFIFHVLLLKLQHYFIVTLANGGQVNVMVYITDHLFGSFSPQNASLSYSLLFLGLNVYVAGVLYYKKIFIAT